MSLSEDRMKYAYRGIFLVPILFAALLTARVESQNKSEEIKRGKYLVEEVAKCPECHTPRDKNNQLDPERWLQGAPIWIQPVFKTADWAELAPSLAGLGNYTEAQMVRILEKGERANGGGTVQPPMHIYRMNHPDAEAIIAYLKSLPVHP
jgi:mono/diheme cytochrome c family protein